MIIGVSTFRLCSVFVITVTIVVAVADVASVPENMSCISKSPSLDIAPTIRDSSTVFWKSTFAG